MPAVIPGALVATILVPVAATVMLVTRPVVCKSYLGMLINADWLWIENMHPATFLVILRFGNTDMEQVQPSRPLCSRLPRQARGRRPDWRVLQLRRGRVSVSDDQPRVVCTDIYSHNKADCTNPRVERPFTGTCNLCGVEGHSARNCPTATCKLCGEAGHKALECKSRRKIDWNGVPELDAAEAWVKVSKPQHKAYHSWF